MDGSDAIVAWIDSNGKINFTDRHIIGRNVLIDKEQNWFLINSRKSNNLTTIQFKRLINTCDDQDMVIPNGTVRVVVSWNNELPPELRQDNDNRDDFAVASASFFFLILTWSRIVDLGKSTSGW